SRLRRDDPRCLQAGRRTRLNSEQRDCRSVDCADCSAGAPAVHPAADVSSGLRIIARSFYEVKNGFSVTQQPDTVACWQRLRRRRCRNWQNGQPCVLRRRQKYGLISAAVCFKTLPQSWRPLLQSVEPATTPAAGRRSFKMFTRVHKSHKGLFFGLLIVILIVCRWPRWCCCRSRQGQGTPTPSPCWRPSAPCCSSPLHSAVLAPADPQQPVSRQNQGPEDLDGKLLLVGLSGLLCYNLFVVVSFASCLMDEHTAQQGSDHCLFGTGRSGIVTKLNGLKSLLDGAQALSQTFLIAQFSRRKLSRRLYLQGRKPARGIIIALLVANLAMWWAPFSNPSGESPSTSTRIISAPRAGK
uniref:G_PROTEIN_RECEP_F1_2 domain-containing protein n=1 Tax=Macrostomum lignano TaxID=282301 RepID=A0A1I8FNK0_9PLAT